jgi:hypothetical protein
MRTGSRRLAAIARVAAVAALALTLATPASAQFGGLKKKLKAAAAQEGVGKVAPEAAAPAENGAAPAGNAAAPAANTPAPAGKAPAPARNAATGGTLVLDDEVIERLVIGLKALEEEKEKAKAADTPYGRHTRALEAYQEARPKCEAAQQPFYNRVSADPKLGDRYSALVQRMVEEQGKGNQAGYLAYNDSAMALIHPACTVKNPETTDDYYDSQRQAHENAEQQALKASGFNRTEYAQVRERVEMTLQGAPPTDISSSEKSAVAKRSKELKKLLGLEPVPAATRPAPAATVVDTVPAAPAQPAPTLSPAQQAQSACYAQNVQKNEARIEDLGKRAQAAQKVNDMNTMMAIADTIQRIQSAGCK